jgi:hypothetical protein
LAVRLRNFWTTASKGSDEVVRSFVRRTRNAGRLCASGHKTLGRDKQQIGLPHQSQRSLTHTKRRNIIVAQPMKAFFSKLQKKLAQHTYVEAWQGFKETLGIPTVL